MDVSVQQAPSGQEARTQAAAQQAALPPPVTCLVLTRRTGERIVIGEGEAAITLTVCEVRGRNSVRLGVAAPREMPIRRGEVPRPMPEAT